MTWTVSYVSTWKRSGLGSGVSFWTVPNVLGVAFVSMSWMSDTGAAPFCVVF
jgi:hypothetical protein